MCQAVGHPVISLKRVSYAFLNLDGLHPADYRSLTGEEIRRLYALVGLKA
jgi:23S rRNA pseudouridine2605 synthase